MIHVQVLMSTYNGEKYLREQLESLLSQKNVSVSIFVRDDGSTDGTTDILNEYKKEKKLEWYSGKNLRSARSFLDAMKKAPDAEYYAFCDQDDYWKPEKLEVAVNSIKNVGNSKPALYCSKTELVDKNLLPLTGNKERVPFRQMDFSTAFIINNVAGCTMVFNKKLRDLILKYTPETIGMHDSWTYKVCVSCNGYIYCDQNSYILYRQHGNNVLGGTYSPIKTWRRRIKALSESPCYRSKVAAEVLKGYQNDMTEEHVQQLQLLATYNTSILKRLKLLFSSVIKTPFLYYNVIFKCAVLLGKY